MKLGTFNIIFGLSIMIVVVILYGEKNMINLVVAGMMPYLIMFDNRNKEFIQAAEKATEGRK